MQQKMSKKPHHSKEKKISRQKSNDDSSAKAVELTPPKKQYDPPPNYKCDGLKSKQKDFRNPNKLSHEKKGLSPKGLKFKSDRKQQLVTYALCMKSELKQRLMKNCLEKQKKDDQIPTLPKSKQKNYKVTDKIQRLQYQLHKKGSSQHSLKAQKQKRVNVQQKKSDQRSKQKRKIQNDLVGRQVNSPELDAVSFEISQAQAERIRFQQKLDNNRDKITNGKTNLDHNLKQLFRLYKRAYEVEDPKTEQKLQQSNKKTNYNTNQSKNSTAHHNHFAQSRAGELHHRGKSRDQEKINLEKIGNLIKTQQLKKLQENLNKNYSNLVRAEMIQLNHEGFAQNRSQVKQKRIVFFQNAEKVVSFAQNAIQEVQKEAQSSHQLIETPRQTEKKLTNYQRQVLQQLFKHPKKLELKENKKFKESERLEKRFEKSKFYVPSVPKFTPKREENSQKEDQRQSEAIQKPIPQEQCFQKM